MRSIIEWFRQQWFPSKTRREELRERLAKLGLVKE